MQPPLVFKIKELSPSHFQKEEIREKILINDQFNIIKLCMDNITKQELEYTSSNIDLANYLVKEFLLTEKEVQNLENILVKRLGINLKETNQMDASMVTEIAV